jgi:hypothetical protein
MLIGSEEIRRREVKGTFRRFHYTNNGYLCFVYCHKVQDLWRLVSWWQRMSNVQCKGKYTYSIPDLSFEGQDIQLEDIPADQGFKVKALLYSQGVEYIQ